MITFTDLHDMLSGYPALAVVHSLRPLPKSVVCTGKLVPSTLPAVDLLEA